MISTHVTFGPRGALRETGKVHGLPDAELTRLTRRIPHWGVGSLEEVVAGAAPECRGLPADDAAFRRLLALGQRVMGHPRHLSVHAGGIVIAPGPLTDFVPLERAAKGLVVTQFDMGPVEELGLIKIDLLSQRSLGVLQDAAAAVAAHTGAAPPVGERERILADPATRALIREGRTMGCFYVESPAMALAPAEAAHGDLRGADRRQLGDPPRRRRERHDAGVHRATPPRPGTRWLHGP